MWTEPSLWTPRSSLLRSSVDQSLWADYWTGSSLQQGRWMLAQRWGAHPRPPCCISHAVLLYLDNTGHLPSRELERLPLGACATLGDGAWDLTGLSQFG